MISKKDLWTLPQSGYGLADPHTASFLFWRMVKRAGFFILYRLVSFS